MPHVALEPGEEILCKARISWAAYIIAVILLLVLMITGQMSGLLTTELILTNKRLIGRRGLFLRRNLAVPYAGINLVRVRRGLAGRIFNYGELVILAGDGKRIVFMGIRDPDDIKMQIEEAAEILVLGHTLSQYTSERF